MHQMVTDETLIRSKSLLEHTKIISRTETTSNEVSV